MSQLKINSYLFLLTFFSVTACVENSEVKTTSRGLTVVNRLDTVAELMAQRGTNAALGDTPGELAYQRMVDAQANRRPTTELGIYTLETPAEPVAHISSRSAALSLTWSAAQRVPGDGENVLGGPFTRKDSARIIGMRNGEPWALEYNGRSGSERLFSRDKFHVGLGPITQLDMNAYINAAGAFTQTMRSTGGLHVYKTRRYLNATDSDASPRVDQEVYQVAVAYGSDIGGVPVIGPGGKVSVHLANGMQPVSYESTIRPLTETRARTTAVDLLTTEDAEAAAWARLALDELGPHTHQISSKQFGYLRRGKSSTQSIVAPTFAFFFAPVTDPGTKRIETISAVLDPAMRALIDADEQAERARKTTVDEGDVRQELPAIQ
jgi:hypothetical protein